VLHLGNRVVLQDDDQLAALLGLLQAFGLATIVVFQRYHGIGIGLIVRDDDGHVQLAGRLGQAIAADTERVDAQRLNDWQLLFRFDGLINALLLSLYQHHTSSTR
jgi:hypothetical protein